MYRTRFNYKKVGEKLSTVDHVNRAGYVPLDLHVERMKLAGAQLQEAMSYQFNYELKDFIASGKSIDEYTKDSNVKRRFYDKIELDSMYKDKLNKFSAATKQLKTISDYRAEYDRIMHDKEVVEEAINNYKREQDSKNL